jgi:DNA-binding transcriptional LysR family regulator
MDKIKELEFLVRVADTGSLSKAAEDMGISNPAASRLLTSLESRLAIRLVERNTRRLYFTSEGEEFCHRARSILSDLAEAEASVNAASFRPSGKLRVSASLSFAMQQIAPRLAKYQSLYPHVQIHIESSNRYLDLIDNGIDVAIRTREYESDSNITIRKLGKTRRVLTASPRYVAKYGKPTTPQELVEHPILIYTLANNPYELKFTKDKESLTIPIQGVLESNDGQILKSAALEGIGLLIQPAYIVYDDIVAGRLIPVLDDWELPTLQINIAYPSRKYLSAKVRSFIDFMVDEFETNEFEKKWTSKLA